MDKDVGMALQVGREDGLWSLEPPRLNGPRQWQSLRHGITAPLCEHAQSLSRCKTHPGRHRHPVPAEKGWETTAAISQAILKRVH